MTSQRLPFRPAIVIGLAVTGAHAQAAESQSGCNGSPCCSRPYQAIVQDRQGFVIRTAGRVPNKPETSATPIGLGAGLRLDSDIFARAARRQPEAINALRR